MSVPNCNRTPTRLVHTFTKHVIVKLLQSIYCNMVAVSHFQYLRKHTLVFHIPSAVAMAARRPYHLIPEESFTIEHIERLALQLAPKNVKTFVSTGFNARGPDNSFLAAVLASNRNTPLCIMFGPYSGADRLEALSGLLGAVESDMNAFIIHAGYFRGGPNAPTGGDGSDVAGSSDPDLPPISQSGVRTALKQESVDTATGENDHNEHYGEDTSVKKEKPARAGRKASVPATTRVTRGETSKGKGNEEDGHRVLRSGNVKGETYEGRNITRKGVKAKKTGKNANDVIEEGDEEDG